MSDLIKDDGFKNRTDSMSFDYELRKHIQLFDSETVKSSFYPIFMEDKERGIKYKVGEVQDADKARIIQELIDTHL